MCVTKILKVSLTRLLLIGSDCFVFSLLSIWFNKFINWDNILVDLDVESKKPTSNGGNESPYRRVFSDLNLSVSYNWFLNVILCNFLFGINSVPESKCPIVVIWSCSSFFVCIVTDVGIDDVFKERDRVGLSLYVHLILLFSHLWHGLSSKKIN